MGVKVVVSGGTGVIGRSAVPALHTAGHEVVVLSRRPENNALIEQSGATPAEADLFAVETLVPAYDGADVVVNLATHIPVGYAALWPGAWRRNDALRTVAVANVVEAARRAGVRRVVQESVSFLYADAGDEWIDEDSRLEVTPATESAAVAESHVQEYVCDSRAGVVLRFGSIVGGDEMTRFWLRAAAHGRPVGVGRPEAWAHLVHTDDLGSAVVAALQAPSGVYNVGAEPIRRAELVDGYAAAAGVESAGLMRPLLRWFAGARMEPLARSLRISSERFVTLTGWKADRSKFDPSWFEAAMSPTAESAP